MTNENTLTIKQLIDQLEEIATTRGMGDQINTGIGSISTDGIVLSFEESSLVRQLKRDIEDLEDRVNSLDSQLEALNE